MLVYQLINAKKSLDIVSNYQGIDFAYAVFKNKQLIDNKLSEVEFIKEVKPEVVEYENKRISLCEKYSKKDKDGKPLIEKDLYSIENNDEFKSKMDELFNEYKLFIEERQSQIELFNLKMNQEANIEFVKISKDQIPSTITTASEIEQISFMID